MPRYKITIEYDGTPFYGWQKQKGGSSVQETLEEAIFLLCGNRAETFVGGRTDAGVHALGQVCHFDLEKNYPAYVIQDALNAYLRNIGNSYISVIAVQEVEISFHARFSATKRAYVYKILNRRAPSPLLCKRVWHVVLPLDVERMQEGAQFFLGHHDFTTFRAAECQASSPFKTMDVCEIQKKEHLIEVHVESRSFLHHQVRNMVGALSLVGLKRWAPLDIKKALDARDRKKGGPTAPPQGLYLKYITYA